jgi:hypothetical protein
MLIPHIAHAPGRPKSSAWTPVVRTRLNNPATKLLGTLLLLVVLGMMTGQILGHLLAAGIENLLDVVALD